MSFKHVLQTQMVNFEEIKRNSSALNSIFEQSQAEILLGLQTNSESQRGQADLDIVSFSWLIQFL